jgi:signal transduction histidine kinase
VEEMSSDLTRLVKVADRFGKIGSETTLADTNLNEVVGGCVHYFKTRIPRKVTLSYNGLAMAPITARINGALFEWVVENLLKNALDALQGFGNIEVRLSEDQTNAYVDVCDTGKGIAKSNWKTIFEPGYTTKTRGWGLGLSLSKRIIEEYHNGKIGVVESELGKGTTIRVSIRKSDS